MISLLAVTHSLPKNASEVRLGMTFYIAKTHIIYRVTEIEKFYNAANRTNVTSAIGKNGKEIYCFAFYDAHTI